MKQNVNNSRDQCVAADRLLQKLDAHVKRVNDTADYLENQSRRNNLRVEGPARRGRTVSMKNDDVLLSAINVEFSGLSMSTQSRSPSPRALTGKLVRGSRPLKFLF